MTGWCQVQSRRVSDHSDAKMGACANVQVAPPNRRLRDRRAALRLWASALLIVAANSVDAREIVRLDHVGERETVFESFRLQREITLHVRCEGAVGPDADEAYAYGWILSAANREVVWRLTPQNSSSGRGTNRVFDGEITLAPGDYIAYFSSFWQGRTRSLRLFDKEILKWRIDSDKSKRPREARAWGITIETLTDGDAADIVELRGLPEVGNDATFVKFVEVGDDEFLHHGFTLPNRTQVQVYCQGEFPDAESGAVDLGWIINAETRERVWEFGPNNFRHGGGAPKNKLTRETITLPAGNYVASYASDDSHSFAGWYAQPPFDPQGWGLMLSATSVEAARRIKPFDDSDDPNRHIVSLIRQRNGAYAAQGFVLPEKMRLRVYSIGEYDASNHEFVDHGWIARFDDDNTVWEMSRRNTVHAGGASKNRAADQLVELPAGAYVAYYVTDGSHAYRSFNAVPPHDPTYWGLQVSLAARDADASRIERFNPEDRRAKDDGNFLVRLLRVRNDQHVRQQFTLTKPTRVQISALGEGQYHEMYDYGWIENAETGQWVWEMTLNNTRHAGGARKNRGYQGVLMLDRGTYEAHYVTDGSHAWGDWNQPRPRQPQRWGMTVQALVN